jgi:hypothetical protein
VDLSVSIASLIFRQAPRALGMISRGVIYVKAEVL